METSFKPVDDGVYPVDDIEAGDGRKAETSKKKSNGKGKGDGKGKGNGKPKVKPNQALMIRQLIAKKVSPETIVTRVAAAFPQQKPTIGYVRAIAKKLGVTAKKTTKVKADVEADVTGVAQTEG
jgi:hypothetical protein